MPSTTANGLPYPLPTDPISHGADDIHNLATAVDALVNVPAVMTMTGGANASLATGAWGMLGGFAATQTIGAMQAVTNGVRVTQAGVYIVTASVQISGNAGGTRRGIGIWSSASAGAGGSGKYSLHAQPGANAIILSRTALLPLGAGTYIGVSAYHDISAVTLAASSGTLDVARISPMAAGFTSEDITDTFEDDEAASE